MLYQVQDSFQVKPVLVVRIFDAIHKLQPAAQELHQQVASGNITIKKGDKAMELLQTLVHADCGMQSELMVGSKKHFDVLCAHRQLFPNSSQIAVLRHGLDTADELLPVFLEGSHKASTFDCHQSCRKCMASLSRQVTLAPCSTSNACVS